MDADSDAAVGECGMNAQKSEVFHHHPLKTVVVGHEGSGRTALIHALASVSTSPSSATSPSKAECEEGEGECCVSVCEFGSHFTVYDCTGPACFLPWYRAFFSSEALYVVVVDLTGDVHSEVDDLRRHLREITAVKFDAVVALVATKVDLVNGSARGELLAKYDAVAQAWFDEQSQVVRTLRANGTFAPEPRIQYTSEPSRFVHAVSAVTREGMSELWTSLVGTSTHLFPRPIQFSCPTVLQLCTLIEAQCDPEATDEPSTVLCTQELFSRVAHQIPPPGPESVEHLFSVALNRLEFMGRILIVDKGSLVILNPRILVPMLSPLTDKRFRAPPNERRTFINSLVESWKTVEDLVVGEGYNLDTDEVRACDDLQRFADTGSMSPQLMVSMLCSRTRQLGIDVPTAITILRAQKLLMLPRSEEIADPPIPNHMVLTIRIPWGNPKEFCRDCRIDQTMEWEGKFWPPHVPLSFQHQFIAEVWDLGDIHECATIGGILYAEDSFVQYVCVLDVVTPSLVIQATVSPPSLQEAGDRLDRLHAKVLSAVACFPSARLDFTSRNLRRHITDRKQSRTLEVVSATHLFMSPPDDAVSEIPPSILPVLKQEPNPAASLLKYSLHQYFLSSIHVAQAFGALSPNWTHQTTHPLTVMQQGVEAAVDSFLAWITSIREPPQEKTRIFVFPLLQGLSDAELFKSILQLISAAIGLPVCDIVSEFYFDWIHVTINIVEAASSKVVATSDITASSPSTPTFPSISCRGKWRIKRDKNQKIEKWSEAQRAAKDNTVVWNLSAAEFSSCDLSDGPFILDFSLSEPANPEGSSAAHLRLTVHRHNSKRGGATHDVRVDSHDGSRFLCIGKYAVPNSFKKRVLGSSSSSSVVPIPHIPATTTTAASSAVAAPPPLPPLTAPPRPDPSHNQCFPQRRKHRMDDQPPPALSRSKRTHTATTVDLSFEDLIRHTSGRSITSSSSQQFIPGLTPLSTNSSSHPPSFPSPPPAALLTNFDLIGRMESQPHSLPAASPGEGGSSMCVAESASPWAEAPPTTMNVLESDSSWAGSWFGRLPPALDDSYLTPLFNGDNEFMKDCGSTKDAEQ